MDSYLSQLMLSIAIFAPGLMLLAGLAFVGLLVAAEKLLTRNAKQPPASAATPMAAHLAHNPPAGPGIAALKRAAAEAPAAAVESEAGAEQPANKAANVH